MSDAKLLEGIGEYQFGFSDPETSVFKSSKGLNREVVGVKTACCELLSHANECP